jgi:hypothetical protein
VYDCGDARRSAFTCALRMRETQLSVRCPSGSRQELAAGCIRQGSHVASHNSLGDGSEPCPPIQPNCRKLHQAVGYSDARGTCTNARGFEQTCENSRITSCQYETSMGGKFRAGSTSTSSQITDTGTPHEQECTKTGCHDRRHFRRGSHRRQYEWTSTENSTG